ncbi:MAG: hypothetical protein M2R45_04246 [Verrucomicrobia subdivision 3 bacterium]|nr:hypothetical protein [Limisphaerales bacterium]MCS1412630.1 hypothetical protein [Limisphaerales bacterium]
MLRWGNLSIKPWTLSLSPCLRLKFGWAVFISFIVRLSSVITTLVSLLLLPLFLLGGPVSVLCVGYDGHAAIVTGRDGCCEAEHSCDQALLVMVMRTQGSNAIRSRFAAAIVSILPLSWKTLDSTQRMPTWSGCFRLWKRCCLSCCGNRRGLWPLAEDRPNHHLRSVLPFWRIG